MNKTDVLETLRQMIPKAEQTAEQTEEWRDQTAVLAGALKGQIIALTTCLELDIKRDANESLRFDFEEAV